MSQHVLIAEDDRGIHEMHAELLRDEGYMVHAVEDGKLALDALRASHEPLVTLLDMNMPRMDGIAVLCNVEAGIGLATRHRYILMTANERTLSLAFIALLTRLSVSIIAKPFDVDNMLGSVAHAMKRPVDFDFREE